MKNRPSVIPLWMPIPDANSLDANKKVISTASTVSHDDDDDSVKLSSESCQSEISATSESIPTILSPYQTLESCTDSVGTFSPDPKRIRCGTRPDCMEDDPSNAVTVEWARA
jgi:hypothetical protein